MSEDLRAALRRHFGFETFREGQEEVIRRLLAGGRVLALLPTGAGKSLCYQLPALLLDGLTLVVSPLIALMQDQVSALQSRGIPAARLDSSLDEAEAARVWEALRAGSLKLLYTSPEGLARTDLRECLRQRPPVLLAVDEAHCMSEWGHQFRPDYLLLGKTVRKLGSPAVLALTATATPQVARDIRAAFKIARADQVQTSFQRPNLSLRVTPCTPGERQALLLARLRENPLPAVVYVTRQQTAEAVATALRRTGLRARAYHAGLSAADRAEAQAAFAQGGADIIVATLAFGMGIDKADIRAVYHYNLPKSLENYQQEIGRAGRDGEPALCEMFPCQDDVTDLESLVLSSAPSPRALRSLVDHLLRQGQRLDLSIYELATALDLRTAAIETVLARLELDGLLVPEGAYHAVLQFRPVQDEKGLLAGRAPAERAFIAGLLARKEPRRRWIRVENEANAAPPPALVSLLNALQESGEIELRPSGARRAYRLTTQARACDPAEVARRVAADFAEQERRSLERLRQVAAFAAEPGCLTRHLLRHFGEKTASRCGHCESCLQPRRQSRRLPQGEAPEWTPAETAAVQALVRERLPALRGARQIARFLCGVGSPASSRARLYRREDFGLLARFSFREVLAQAESLAGSES